jgi:hypothetical protein
VRFTVLGRQVFCAPGVLKSTVEKRRYVDVRCIDVGGMRGANGVRFKQL